MSGNIFFFFFTILKIFTYLLEESVSRGEAERQRERQRERENLKQAFIAFIAEPDSGLDSMNREIMT